MAETGPSSPLFGAALEDSEPNPQLSNYERAAINNYGLVSEIIARAIEHGKLPEEYALPSLDIFREEIEVLRLRSSYEAMEKAGLEPEVIFAPQGLAFGYWDMLLEGYSLPGNQKKSGGIASSHNILGVNRFNGLWKMAIISGNSEAPIVNISPDGKRGSARKEEVIRSLKDLLGIADGSSPADIIRQASPSPEEVIMLQLMRLARGQCPVDRSTSSMTNRRFDNEAKTLFMTWGPEARKVIGYLAPTGGLQPTRGIRPTDRPETTL